MPVWDESFNKFEPHFGPRRVEWPADERRAALAWASPLLVAAEPATREVSCVSPASLHVTGQLRPVMAVSIGTSLPYNPYVRQQCNSVAEPARMEPNDCCVTRATPSALEIPDGVSLTEQNRRR